MQLSIISLNYKKPDLTIASLKSLYKAHQRKFEKKEFEYIVVDNNSEDDSAKMLSQEVKKYPGCHFVQNSTNSGFGAGNNLGAKSAKGKHILFLNNDTKIEGEGIADMVDFLENHENVAILGGQLRNFDGTSQSSTGKFYTIWSLFLLLLGMQRLGVTDKNPQKIQAVDWVKGALLMIRKEVFDALKGFDEHIFMYTEDMELCYRAKKKGYSVYFYPTDGILHQDQGSSNRTFAIVHIYEGILYFYTKHIPSKVGIVRFLLKLKATILIIIGKIVGNSYLAQTYEKALTALG